MYVYVLNSVGIHIHFFYYRSEAWLFTRTELMASFQAWPRETQSEESSRAQTKHKPPNTEIIAGM